MSSGSIHRISAFQKGLASGSQRGPAARSHFRMNFHILKHSGFVKSPLECGYESCRRFSADSRSVTGKADTPKSVIVASFWVRKGVYFASWRLLPLDNVQFSVHILVVGQFKLSTSVFHGQPLIAFPRRHHQLLQIHSHV